MSLPTYTRRVQLVGRSTYVISLPSSWVRATGITPKSEVSLEVLPDMSLRLFVPGKQVISKSTQYVVLVGSNYSVDDIVREVIGGYVAGVASIKISFKDLSPDVIERVKYVLRNKLMGFEVVDEDSYSVTFQVVVDPNIADLRMIMERASRLTYGMHLDIISYARGELKRDVLEAMGSRDDLVDKLYLLALRLLTTVLSDPRELSRRGLNYPEVPYILMFLKNVERIADHAVAIASIVRDYGIDGRLLNVYINAVELFREATKAFIASDKELSLKVAKNVRTVKEAEEEYVRLLSTSQGLNVHTARLLDVITRMIARSLDIVELTINVHAVRVSNQSKLSIK